MRIASNRSENFSEGVKTPAGPARLDDTLPMPLAATLWKDFGIFGDTIAALK
jgi:hypothetical protein